MRILTNRKHKLMYNIAVRHSRFPRGSAGAHISNHTTTIIIAVVASVGGFVLVVVFWSLYSRYSRRRSAAPLPPVQPLAHQREHQLSSFAQHKATTNRDTWYSASPSSHRSLLPIASDTSLLPRPSDAGNVPSRQGSFQTYETGEEHSSTSEPLSPPNPGFYDANMDRSPSTSSISSGEQSSSSPATPFTSPSQSSSPSLISPPPHHANAPNRKRVSMLSSSTGRSSRLRTSTFRGAPHSLHNNVQIVLPTPLAPELYPHMIGAEDAQGRSITIGEDRAGARMSQALTDKWVPVGNMATSPLPFPSKKLASQSRGRSADAPPQNRRSTSNPAPASRLRQSTVPQNERVAASGRTPSMPLPRIPSAPHLADKRYKATGPSPSMPPSTPPSSFPVVVSVQQRPDGGGMPQQTRSHRSMESRSSRRLSLS